MAVIQRIAIGSNFNEWVPLSSPALWQLHQSETGKDKFFVEWVDILELVAAIVWFVRLLRIRPVANTIDGLNLLN